MPPANRVVQRAMVMGAFDRTSFSAGQDAGTRTAACLARLAALELLDASRWWNRRRHRLMADALVACAEELEGSADADRSMDQAEPEPATSSVASATRRR